MPARKLLYAFNVLLLPFLSNPFFSEGALLATVAAMLLTQRFLAEHIIKTSPRQFPFCDLAGCTEKRRPQSSRYGVSSGSGRENTGIFEFREVQAR